MRWQLESSCQCMKSACDQRRSSCDVFHLHLADVHFFSSCAFSLETNGNSNVSAGAMRPRWANFLCTSLQPWPSDSRPSLHLLLITAQIGFTALRLRGKQDAETGRLSDAAASRGKPDPHISSTGFTQESISAERRPCLVATECDRVAADADSAAAVDAAQKEVAH